MRYVFKYFISILNITLICVIILWKHFFPTLFNDFIFVDINKIVYLTNIFVLEMSVSICLSFHTPLISTNGHRVCRIPVNQGVESGSF